MSKVCTHKHSNKNNVYTVPRSYRRALVNIRFLFIITVDPDTFKSNQH